MEASRPAPAPPRPTKKPSAMANTNVEAVHAAAAEVVAEAVAMMWRQLHGSGLATQLREEASVAVAHHSALVSFDADDGSDDGSYDGSDDGSDADGAGAEDDPGTASDSTYDDG
jgi:hypothetical protein